MINTCHIHGLGTAVPARILTNDELSRVVDTNDEWIVTRTGIKERRVLEEGQCSSDLGCEAAKKALAEAGLTPADVTHLFVGTCTPEYMCPSTASIVAQKLGCGMLMALDFNAACSGFLYGLSLAEAMLNTHKEAVILFVCAEALTRRVNWQDRSTCVLFGDGATATVLRATSEGAIGSVNAIACHTNANLWNLITVGGGTHKS